MTFHSGKRMVNDYQRLVVCRTTKIKISITSITRKFRPLALRSSMNINNQDEQSVLTNIDTTSCSILWFHDWPGVAVSNHSQPALSTTTGGSLSTIQYHYTTWMLRVLYCPLSFYSLKKISSCPSLFITIINHHYIIAIMNHH